MQFFKTSPTDAALDAAIADVFRELAGLNADSEEYAKAAAQLNKLMLLKKETNPSWRPSPDAVIKAVGSLVGIVLILNFEKTGLIKSQALSFVGKF
jgi:hypothetical protein